MSNEVIIIHDRSTGKFVLSIAKGTTFEKAAPVLRRISAELSAEFGPDSFRIDGDPERHLHLHEDKATVQHRQRV